MKTTHMCYILAFCAITTTAIYHADVKIRSIGQMHSYEQEWKVEFIFSLNDFFKNANTLNKCIFELKAICESNPRLVNCKYFLEFISLNYQNMEKDINQIKRLSRQKRFWNSMQGATLSRVFTYSAVAIFMLDVGFDKIYIYKQSQRTQEIAEQLNKHLKNHT